MKYTSIKKKKNVSITFFLWSVRGRRCCEWRILAWVAMVCEYLLFFFNYFFEVFFITSLFYSLSFRGNIFLFSFLVCSFFPLLVEFLIRYISGTKEEKTLSFELKENINIIIWQFILHLFVFLSYLCEVGFGRVFSFLFIILRFWLSGIYDSFFKKSLPPFIIVISCSP